MQAAQVTHFWMAGVMVIMAVFGVIAVVGYLRQSRRDPR
jgi:hypothetical protein